jgi:hypothetical protein
MAYAQTAWAGISDCCYFCTQIADNLCRKFRPRFDYKNVRDFNAIALHLKAENVAK